MSIATRQIPGPGETRGLDTSGLRANFLVENLFETGRIHLTYSHLDRTIIGGVVPGPEAIALPAPKPIGNPNFLDRRELGVFCIEGAGTVTVDGATVSMEATDCLYIPVGCADVRFASAAGSAKFYLVSAPAHRRTTLKKIPAEEAIRHDLGTQSEANIRTLRQYIHPDNCESCQLVMGMTTIADGSAWNTMPTHTHDRRSEVYFYFGMEDDTRVFHFMGEPTETRHLVVAREQAILSPGWSIHCGAGTGAYSFIWSMAGDNQDFTDMDMIAMEELR